MEALLNDRDGMTWKRVMELVSRLQPSGSGTRSVVPYDDQTDTQIDVTELCNWLRRLDKQGEL